MQKGNGVLFSGEHPSGNHVLLNFTILEEFKTKKA
jgi:hypothetical protein